MSKQQFTELLVTNFEVFLDAYNRHCPFKKYGQLQNHVATFKLRNELGSAKAAINDTEFIASLYNTLQAWGIGARKSKLKTFEEFTKALKDNESEISEFEGAKLGDITDVAASGKKLARLIHNLGIVENKSRIVAGTKALHHLLPEFIVPMDREYTQKFFGWHNPQFQDFPQECFIEAFKTFNRIAHTIDLSQYVKDGWFTSRTKVIDNAIVGFWRWVEFDAKEAIDNMGVDSDSPKNASQITP